MYSNTIDPTAVKTTFCNTLALDHHKNPSHHQAFYVSKAKGLQENPYGAAGLVVVNPL